jgi:hypothetical protein
MPKLAASTDDVFKTNLLKFKTTKALTGALTNLHDVLRDVSQVSFGNAESNCASDLTSVWAEEWREKMDDCG